MQMTSKTLHCLFYFITLGFISDFTLDKTECVSVGLISLLRRNPSDLNVKTNRFSLKLLRLKYLMVFKLIPIEHENSVACKLNAERFIFENVFFIDIERNCYEKIIFFFGYTRAHEHLYNI